MHSIYLKKIVQTLLPNVSDFKNNTKKAENKAGDFFYVYMYVHVCYFMITSDLKHGDQHHQDTNGGHHAAVVGEQGLAAATLPHVELLSVVVIAVVGGVVCHLHLDAWPGGAGVAAAERHAVHQVLAVHVAANAAKRIRQRVIVFMSRYDRMEVRVRWAVRGRETT